MKRPKNKREGRTIGGFCVERQQMPEEIERHTFLRDGREWLLRIFAPAPCDGAGRFSPEPPIRSRHTPPTPSTTD